VKLAVSGRVGGAGGCPTVKAGIISAASVHKAAAVISAPNNHFAAGPHCCVSDSADWRVGGAGACPTVGGRIVRAAGVEILTATVIRVAAPNDHFTAGPYCRVIFSAVGRADDVGGCPSISAGIIFAAGVKSAAAIRSAPHDHFTAAPHCCVAVPRSGRVGGAGSCPTASTGIISPPGVQRAQTVAIVSAPHDHFTARPDCPMDLSGIGRVGGVCSCPSVGSEIVFAAGVGIAGARDVSAPDDHFTAGPHCGVTVPGGWRVGGAGGCPTVSAGIISSPGVEVAAAAANSAPDDHFTSRPHCGVPAAGIGRVGDAGGSPRVVGAATRREGYHRKLVVRAHCRYCRWPLHFCSGSRGLLK